MASAGRWRRAAKTLSIICAAGTCLGLSTASSQGETMATTPELRQAAITSCTGDVLRLCPTVLFDEQKIFACMRSNRALLTPGCRAVFDQGAKTVRR